MSREKRSNYQAGTFHLHLICFSILLLLSQLVIVSCVQPAEKPTMPHGSTRGSTSSSKSSKPGVDQIAIDDFHHLTDKLTQKIMKDIEERKKNDPNWGKPEMNPDGNEMTEEEMRAKSECEFQCPAGKRQVGNPEYKIPDFKNCKKYDHSWDKIPGSSQCCVAHLRCYHTCNRDRMQCDTEFGMCMENICEDLQDAGKIVTEKVIEACASAMGLLGMMIMEPGCKLYPKAQDAACRCVSAQSQQQEDKFGSSFKQSAQSIDPTSNKSHKEKEKDIDIQGEKVEEKDGGIGDKSQCDIGIDAHDDNECDGDVHDGDNKDSRKSDADDDEADHNDDDKEDDDNARDTDVHDGNKDEAVEGSHDTLRDEL